MGKKILLIEDEAVIIEILEKKLVKEGYEIAVARNGVQGLKILKESSPDLILLDLVMPEMGGFEFMETINLPENRHLVKVPIIIISNSGQPVDLERAQELGAKDWLIKTEFQPQEVIDKIKKQLNK